MAKLKSGCIWLLGPVALAVVGTACLRSHFASAQRAREQARKQEDFLDRSFNARPPAPLEVRVMLSTAQGGYQVPADQPSFHRHIAPLGKLPAILVITGCGFPVWGKDVPLNVAVLSVDEDPHLLEHKTLYEACVSRDGPAMTKTVEQKLSYLTRYIERAAWIDKSRVMLAGYGEAAPLVAAYPGHIKQRLTLGDPCFVPWSNVNTNTPILMLFTSERQGLMDDDEPPRPPDIAALAQGAGPSFPKVIPCPGLKRPSITSPARAVAAPGYLGMFERPDALLRAQKLAYDNL